MAVNVGVIPETGLLPASRRVIVTVDVATLLASTGPVPVIVELAATGAPAVKTTVPSDLDTGVAIDSVLVSAIVDERVQVDIPLAFVAEHIP